MHTFLTQFQQKKKNWKNWIFWFFVKKIVFFRKSRPGDGNMVPDIFLLYYSVSDFYAIQQ